MEKVFISHSSIDKLFVRKLKNDIDINGIKTWVDEDELELGDILEEKLLEAIDKSSHFIIILSPDSVKSKWVELELEKASKGPTSKIIPIVYRPCKVPAKIEGRLHGDLSKEVVQIAHDKLEFVSTGYNIFLVTLINSLRSNKELSLSSKDKSRIKEDVQKSTSNLKTIERKIGNLRLNIEVYATKESKQVFIDKILEHTKNTNSPSNGKPIILPNIISHIFKDIEVGEILTLEHEDITAKACFAGFRRGDLDITIDLQTQKKLQVANEGIYLVRFNYTTKTISFYHEE